MYLTSMSVFLSSSAIISRWNLLNFRRGGVGWRGGGARGSERREHMQMIREQACGMEPVAPLLSTGGGRRRAVSARRAIIRAGIAARPQGRVPSVSSALVNESETKRGKELLCAASRSSSLEEEWGRRRPSLRPCRGAIKVSAAGQTDGSRESARLRRQCLVSDAPDCRAAEWSSWIVSRPDETP